MSIENISSISLSFNYFNFKWWYDNSWV